jgi:hypothetical protein
MLRPFALAYLIAWFGALYGLPELVENEVQLFMASHYAATPFNLWDPRWYGGFDVSFRPPGFYVLVAAFAQVPGVGLERAYALTLIAFLVALVAAVVWLAVELRLKKVESYALAVALNPAPYVLAFNDGHGALVAALAFATAQAAALLYYVRTREKAALVLGAAFAALAAMMHLLGLALCVLAFLAVMSRGQRKTLLLTMGLVLAVTLSALAPFHPELGLTPKDMMAIVLLLAPALIVPRFRGAMGVLLVATAYLLGESAHAAPTRHYREALTAIEEVLRRPDARGFSYVAYGVGSEDLALSRRTVATLAGGALPGRDPPNVDALPHLRWVITAGAEGVPGSGFRRAAAFGGGVVLWERNVAPAPDDALPVHASYWWTLSTPLFFLLALIAAIKLASK